LLDHDHLGEGLKLEPRQHRLEIGPARWIVRRAIGYDVGRSVQIAPFLRARKPDRG